MIYNILRDYFSPAILKFIIVAYTFCIFDFISGFSSAWKERDIQSHKLRSGLDKFVKYTLFISIGAIFDLISSQSFVCIAFCCVICSIELKSLDENFKKIGINIPDFVLNFFKNDENESGYIVINQKKKSAADLVKWCNNKLGCLYWYGTFGQKASHNLYKSKKAQYPLQYKWNYEKNMENKQVFDCIGLIKGFLWEHNGKITYNASQDVSANTMRDLCHTGGDISTLPETAGALVFSAGHVGVYIGGGYVIEARGNKYGVVKTKLKERGFTSWGLCPYIEYNKGETEKKQNNNKSNKDVAYYPKYSGNSVSIVDALKSLKINSSMKHRKEIASANDFKAYSGTAKQNIKMLELLKAGKLKKE